MGSHSSDILARLASAVPDSLAKRAQQWTDQQPAEPALSASVILIRDGADGIETYLLHRHSRMPFAAGMVVFPGGRVDPQDYGAGRDPVLVCALRETQEETCVVLTEDALSAWARWVTPEFEPRRYDTHFFVAVMPPEQSARDISGETDKAAWSTPAEALRAQAAGELALMPPTLSILMELDGCGSVAEITALAADRMIALVLPQVTLVEGQWRFSYPSGSTDG